MNTQNKNINFKNYLNLILTTLVTTMSIINSNINYNLSLKTPPKNNISTIHLQSQDVAILEKSFNFTLAKNTQIICVLSVSRINWKNLNYRQFYISIIVINEYVRQKLLQFFNKTGQLFHIHSISNIKCTGWNLHSSKTKIY